MPWRYSKTAYRLAVHPSQSEQDWGDSFLEDLPSLDCRTQLMMLLYPEERHTKSSLRQTEEITKHYRKNQKTQYQLN